jgi:CRP/FNR family transcriptional regulator, cyclic AMP receptor protein
MSAESAWTVRPPFDALGAEGRRALERIAAPLPLRTGRALFYQGDRADAAYLVLGGSLRGVMYRSDESSLEMGRYGEGEWLGLAECVLDSPRLMDAVAEEPCALISFPRPGFERLLGLPGMERFFLREMARRYCTLHSRIELNQPMDRLVRFLLQRGGTSRGEISCTQEEIAEAVGVTRETVNRHLGRLQEEGLVRVGRGSVRVIAMDALRARGERG